MGMRVWPGRSTPLGATWDGSGINFALYSENAEKVELCLFDSAETKRRSARITLPEQTDMVWHVYSARRRAGPALWLSGLWPLRTGRRASLQSEQGPARSLCQGDRPRDCAGPTRCWATSWAIPQADLSFDDRDNASFAPLAAVIDEAFTWGDDRPPRNPWHKTLIYELHVKGFTKLHPGRAGKACAAPTRASAPTPSIRLSQEPGHHGRRTVAGSRFTRRSPPGRAEAGQLLGLQHARLFRPGPRYASVEAAGDAVREFKTMVRNLHAAGIEVILDVVYNHTAEGNQLGPTLSFRGIDNASYYRLSPEDPRYYMDFTGCGNTFHMRNPRVLQLIMDSLRYWITHMHVDGLPVRSGQHAGPRAARSRQAGGASSTSSIRTRSSRRSS